MTTYALVHGAWHDGWCRGPLAAELEGRGHRVVAPDLPCEDHDATFPTYADVAAAALRHEGDDVVVVAHSLGGQTAPLVPARRPVRAIVYLCAIVAEPGRASAELARDDPPPLLAGYERGLRMVDEHRARAWTDEAPAVETLYPDVPEPLAREAFARLRAPVDRALPRAVPPRRAPRRACGVTVCAEDRIVIPVWSRSTAAQRLGVTPIELPGGHTPSLARPAALADAIGVAV